MSVIIRLQNLPWSANALDIRQYFQGLSIPEGGVHIVGGELGDAFIAFSTDEDARQAMLIDGGKIKEVKIKLFLSSRSEMQKVIETARAQSITMQTFMQIPPAQIPSAPVPATQIPPTPSQTSPAMPPISQMPLKTTPEVKPPPLPPLPAPPVPATEAIKPEPESEKKDQDTESVSSKDTKRSRRGRSKSKSKDRSKSRERTRSRSRDRNYRSKDRYRDRRRRDRSRSRDRRDRRRYRDRSRSRDRSARKVSRDRRRDSDRNDRNSSENNINNNVKNVIVPEKEVELASSPMPPKPGFTNSGWVSAGSTEIPESPLTNPIGFSIGKPLVNSSTPSQTQSPKSEISKSLKIPLPQQSLPLSTSQQSIPTSQPASISQPIILPQPPPFPQMPLEVSKDESGQLKSIPFPPNQQSTNPITTQHGPMFAPNQPQLLQNDANKVIHQGQPGPPFMMPPGWNPNMMPMVGNPHLLLGPMPPPMGINNADKAPMPMMNVPMGMYMRPPILPPNENVQSPHLQNDPRIQSGFNMHQLRNDLRDNNSVPQINDFNSQKQSNYAEGRVNTTNQRNPFLNASVEIRNMSMSTTNIDIRRFFQGLQIPAEGVKIIADKKGNKVGIAYVRFSKSFFKDMALKKSGQLLNNSIVEVLHIDDSIFDKASDLTDYPGHMFKDNQNYKGNFDNFVVSNEPTETFTDLIIHEVPPFAKDRDIYNLFKGFNIEDAFVLLRTGRKTATGYVRFRTPVEARRAMAISSRLSIGYTNVKVAICYEHEFSEARDRKNMEEVDEEMMDSKDGGYTLHENRGSRSSKKYSSYDYEEDESDTRYNQVEKRSYNNNKVLLPTPHVKPFDQRPTLGNQNNSSSSFNSRYDKRQQDPSRTSKDFHKKPYTREDFHQKPYLKESGHFHSRLPSRDEFGENRHSVGETNKKSFSHSNINTSFQEQSKKPQVQQPSLNTPTSNKDSKEPAVSLKTPPVNSENTVNNEKQVNVDETKISETSKKDNTNKSKSPQTSDAKLPDIQIPQVNEEITEPKQKEKASDEAQQNNPQTLEKENQMNHGTDCIILRGLPFNANDRDILDFFSDEGLAPTQIHIMLDKLGQPAGDAFCEFNTTEEVSRALTKNRTLMGRSVVAVEPVSREEMMNALGVVVPVHPPEFPGHEFAEHEFPERFPHPDYRRTEFRFPQRGRGFPHFPPRGRGRGGFRARHHAPTELESQNVNSFGKPGCVLALENVPFRAEVQDIIDFFKGYFVTRDNVIRRFDENGKPTGDARVCLNSPEDANHALRMLNQRQIFNRQVHLSLV